MPRHKTQRYYTNHISFVKNNTLDDYINKRNVDNIETLKIAPYQYLYEWLCLHDVEAEDVRYFGVEEDRQTSLPEEKFENNELVMLVHTRSGFYDFYPLCDLYFE